MEGEKDIDIDIQMCVGVCVCGWVYGWEARPRTALKVSHDCSFERIDRDVECGWSGVGGFRVSGVGSMV